MHNVSDFGFQILLFSAAVLSGGVASVTGFGVGSILTPLLAVQIGTREAVVVIAIPHFIATFIRFWMIREHIDRRVLLSFGTASAMGGLIGAFLHSFFQNTTLTLVFGGLLVFAGFMGMTGLSNKMKFQGPLAWTVGVLSGGFGGLVGNQGGIRSAALLTFNLPKMSLVATGTAIGIMVDLARMPVYLVSGYAQIVSATHLISTGIFGVILGTILGIKFLHGIPELTFRKLLGALIFGLGIVMIFAVPR